jgi:hypothetical protein
MINKRNLDNALVEALENMTTEKKDIKSQKLTAVDQVIRSSRIVLNIFRAALHAYENEDAAFLSNPANVALFIADVDRTTANLEEIQRACDILVDAPNAGGTTAELAAHANDLRMALISIKVAIRSLIRNLALHMLQQRGDKYNEAIAILALNQCEYVRLKKIARNTPVPLDEVKAGIGAALDSNASYTPEAEQTICNSINEVIDECIRAHGGNIPEIFGGAALNTIIAPDTIHRDWHIH